MLQFNWLAILASGLLPLFVGAVYYNPKVLGNAWMNASGIAEERLKNANMTKIFGFTLLLGLLLAVFFMPYCVVPHLIHVYSLVAPPGGGAAVPDSPGMQDALAFLKNMAATSAPSNMARFTVSSLPCFVFGPCLVLSLFLNARAGNTPLSTSVIGRLLLP